MRTLAKTLKGIKVSEKLGEAEVIKFEMDKKARKIIYENDSSNHN